MSNKNFLDAASVADYMGTSLPTAYKIIRKLNDELKTAGYITIAGKINKNYFLSKVCVVPMNGSIGGTTNAGL